MTALRDKYTAVLAAFAEFGATVAPNSESNWDETESYPITYSYFITTDFGTFVIQGGNRIDSKCDYCGGGGRWMESELECGGCGKVQGTLQTGISGYLEYLDRTNLYRLIPTRTEIGSYEAIILGNLFWNAVDDLATFWRETQGGRGRR